MDLIFIPVEEFYFALTLAVRTLEDVTTPGLAETVATKLQQELGQPSTVAAASQNTYNYVFRVKDIDNSPNPQLVLSISDWQGSLRISSDYGWTLDSDRKPVRTEKFEQRTTFAQQVKEHLQHWLNIQI
jgi:outer membrane protein assembly factor BamE (lipoprotein component of BamABCDE complex)